jgi:exosortase/archaeosortase family protein
MQLMHHLHDTLQALCEATAASAQWMLAALGTSMQRRGEWLHHPGGFVAEVHLDCTAFWPAVVLVGVLALFGSLARVSTRRFALAAAWGVLALVILNQLRLAGTLWLGVHAPAYWTLMHEVAGPLLMVAAGAAVVVVMVKGLPAGWRLRWPQFVALTVAASAALAGMGSSASASAPSSNAPRAGSTSASGAAPPIVSSVVAPAGAPMISGDLIVKFRDASEPGAQLAAVLAGQRTVASVAPLAARLAGELGVPLTLVQVTSGREALLALDREALGRALLARAGREASVRHAVMTVPPTTSGLPGSELVLRIETHRNTPPATREALGTRLALTGLARPRLVPVEGGAGSAGGGGTVALHYDIDALTLALIAKAQQRPDVEYAQANRLLRPMPASGAASGTPR